MGNWSNFEEFSEPAFKDKRNYVDFDSAMRRFESSRPSQPLRSLQDTFRSQEFARATLELIAGGIRGCGAYFFGRTSTEVAFRPAVSGITAILLVPFIGAWALGDGSPGA
jgi:hypothetical protein